MKQFIKDNIGTITCLTAGVAGFICVQSMVGAYGWGIAYTAAGLAGLVVGILSCWIEDHFL